MTRTMRGVFVLAVLGVMFQVGHFFEHAFQWAMWIFSNRSKPWMSAVADWLAMAAGQLVYPMPDICTDEKAWMAKQMLYGMEVLHLVGNSIFLITIALLIAHFSQKPNWPIYSNTKKLLKWAFAVEAFHLYEHIMLTATTIFLGKPVGFSTLFGGTSLFIKENAVGYRVSWHFFMNLIPTIIMTWALMPHMKSWFIQLNAWRPAGVCTSGTCMVIARDRFDEPVTAEVRSRAIAAGSRFQKTTP